ncbi:hypothetical protein PV327_008426 [Microctonus hyperodae]|uniref:Nuclear RNA export factor 1 n=1 Tax=Microctonus hyperodae TaxID=165561 RepID=A0AA39F355_MICHY|nr:hypothetical protein PV327_008426 [Microctonus hyperodae]
MPKKPFNSPISNGASSFSRNFYFDRAPGKSIAQNTIPNRPRVSFKKQSRSGSKHDDRRLRTAMLDHLDGDITMSSGSNNNNGRHIIFRGRGRGSLIGGRRSPVSQRGSRLPQHTGGRLRQSLLGDCSWYKIQIIYGQKYEKDFIINNLLSYISPDTFTPIMYKVVGQDAIFYVDDQKAATNLINCDRRITTSDGFKISVKVRPGYPNCEVDDAVKERMKLAMAKRYVAETNALDLTQFHLDPELVQDYFCALFRPMMLIAVLNIVAEVIPNLHALNLSNNKLNIIERLNVLSKKFPNLKILYIGDNKIKEINQIDVLKDLNLEELQLKGNPLCNKYKTRNDDYISDVRKRFPKLLRLDGTELPRPILFDIADEGVVLPPTKSMFLNDPRAEKVAIQFMQQYFTIFDGDSRQPLLDAYHENANFSLTIAPSSQIQKFNKYLSDNRNLFRTSEPTRRRKLLKQGRLPIVSFISEMPKTQHYFNSFTMDISLVTELLMLITVTGCFKELDTKDQLIRAFNRTFIIVPEGSGYCIKNEQLHLAHPTVEQEKQAQSDRPIATTSSSQTQQEQSNATMTLQPQMPGPSQLGLQPSTSAAGEPSLEIQQQMTMMLSQQSNMNLEWSLKCLKEVQWNYDTALSAFNDFFKRGEIPPAAFQK